MDNDINIKDEVEDLVVQCRDMEDNISALQDKDRGIDIEFHYVYDEIRDVARRLDRLIEILDLEDEV